MNARPEKLNQMHAIFARQSAEPAFEAKKLSHCNDCGRTRACPYGPMHWAWLVKFTLCSCGDACVASENEISAAHAALQRAIENHLI